MCCKVLISLNPSSGGRFTDEEVKFVTEILENLDQPEALNAILLARVDSGAEDANELAQLPPAIVEFMQRPFNVRQLLQQIIRETIPPNAPGRKRKISDADIPKLLRRADQLRPAISALFQISQASSKRPLPERIKYLEPEYPEACEYLLKYQKQLKIVADDERLMARAASPESGIRLIADAMAGAEFDISARYSIQLVQEARRAVRRRSKRAKLQKI